LTHMHEQGIRLVASGLLARCLIEEIVSRAQLGLTNESSRPL